MSSRYVLWNRIIGRDGQAEFHGMADMEARQRIRTRSASTTRSNAQKTRRSTIGDRAFPIAAWNRRYRVALKEFSFGHLEVFQNCKYCVELHTKNRVLSSA